MNWKDRCRAAAAEIHLADAILIGAGAGIGVDSGLPDFRGNEGFLESLSAVQKSGDVVHRCCQSKQLHFQPPALPGDFMVIVTGFTHQPLHIEGLGSYESGLTINPRAISFLPAMLMVIFKRLVLMRTKLSNAMVQFITGSARFVAMKKISRDERFPNRR